MRKASLGMRYTPCLAEKVRSLRARVAMLEEVSRTKAPKVRAKREIADMEVVVGQSCIERAKHKARIAQLEGNFPELKAMLAFPNAAIASLISGTLC